jgi:hypothetical protein
MWRVAVSSSLVLNQEGADVGNINARTYMYNPRQYDRGWYCSDSTMVCLAFIEYLSESLTYSFARRWIPLSLYSNKALDMSKLGRRSW